MTTSEQTSLIALTDDELAAINTVRTLLQGVAGRTPRTYDAGMVDGAANVAGNALTNFLVVAKVYGCAEMTDGQLYNR